MSCSVKIKALNRLKEDGVISRSREILNYDKFNRLNELYTNVAVEKYGLEAGENFLFSIETNEIKMPTGSSYRRDNIKTKYRAVPNDNLFNELEQLVVNERSFEKQDQVDYKLKSVDILSSDKAVQVFNKGNKNGWSLNKILTELQIPKAHKDIILSKELKDREDIIMSLLSENSFTVEINTAKKDTHVEEGFESIDNTNTPTQYYSDLTVPGGTNYTENEIVAPDILPNIKGHAQFSTDSGIGWFRSDEQEVNESIEEIFSIDRKKPTTRRILEVQSDLFQKGRDEKDLIKTQIDDQIREDIESNLSDALSINDISTSFTYTENGNEITIFKKNEEWYKKSRVNGSKKYSTEKILGYLVKLNYVRHKQKDKVDKLVNEAALKIHGKTQSEFENQNKFLQLLNKKNNWVTFFVQSIVQDSVKKGYNKVLFPKGDTAAKIEGHQTLEEFKREKEGRIKELEELLKPKTFKVGDLGIETQEDADFENKRYKLPEERENEINEEIKTLKQELADVESGQIQLSSIAGFYENNITNILKKNYSIKEYQDEYGNYWTEVDLVNEKLKGNDFDILLKELNDSKTVSPGADYLYTQKDSAAVRRKDIPEESFQDTINRSKDLFGGTFANLTVNEFLRNALHILDLNDTTRAMLKKLLISRAKIKFIDNLKSQDTLAQYDPVTRTIYLDRNKMSAGNEYFNFETILHEIAHDMTVNSLENPKNDEQRQFKSDMNALYEYFKSKSNADLYGFKNVHEFVAEVFSNPIFRNEIDNIPVDGSTRSILDRFIDFVKNLFGISNMSNSQLIVEEIMNIGMMEYNSNNTYASEKAVVFEKKEEKTKAKYREKFTNEITTFDKVIKKILSEIDAVANKSAYKRGKDDENTKRFKEAQKLISDLANTSTTQAVYKYVEFANRELFKLNTSLRNKANSEKGLTSDYLFRANSYTAIYSSLSDIERILDEQYKKSEITEEEYNKIKSQLTKANENYITFRSNYLSEAKEQLVDLLWKYNSKPWDLKRVELEREWNNTKPTANKEQWVNEKLEEAREELEFEAREATRSMLDTVPFDIQRIEASITSEKNLPDLLLKMYSTVLDQADMNVRDATVTLRNQMKKALDEYNPSGINNKQKFGKLTSQGIDGQYYFISKYNPKVYEEYQNLLNERVKVREEKGKKSKEYKEINNKYIQWVNKNIVRNNSTGEFVRPTDKWLNPDYKSLSSSDLKYLNHLKEKIFEADSNTLGHRSLISQIGNATFMRLPSIRQSDLDRILSGDISGLAKDKLQDSLGKVQQDRTEGGELNEIDNTTSDKYAKTLATVTNEERYLVPIHYRAKLDPKDQSLDLPTIVLMNSVMSEEFKAKQALEADANLLIDVIGEADVYKSESITRKNLVSAFSKDIVNPDLVRLDDGKDSNIYKKFKQVTQNRIYNILDASSGKMSGDRINVLTRNVLGYTAHMTLAVNWMSAVPNMLQGKIQNFIEGVGFDTYTRKDLRWAEKKYWNEMMVNGGLKDIGHAVNNNKLNLMIDKFNVLTDFSAVKHGFEKDNRFKALFNTHSLHAFNNMAEHYAQSTLMLAVMSNIKVMNSKGEYLDSNGNVVKDKNLAMNLYDAYTVKDGELVLRDNVDKTSFNPDKKLSDVGLIQVQNLIRKKIIDLHGQYDSKWQSTIQRYWFGKAITMFRKWLIPGFYRRWRGSAYVLSDAIQTYRGKRDGIRGLYELEENQQYYSLEERRIAEGTYTSFARFMLRSVIPGIKQFKLELVTADWNNLTDHEKANVHKVIRELLVTSMMFSAAWLSALAAKDAPDEEEERLFYTLAYMFKRQESELMQYYNPADNFRIFRTPFAALNTIEKTMDLLNQMLPGNIDNVYEKGRNQGEYKAWVKFKKLVPVLSQTERSAEQSYNYLENLTSN